MPLHSNMLVTGQVYEDAILEWLPAGRFQQQQEWHKNLQECADEGLPCLEKWQQETGLTFEYIYLSHVQAKSSALEATLAASSSYQRVYTESGAAIFRRQ